LRGTASIKSGIGASHPVDHAMQTPGRLRGTASIESGIGASHPVDHAMQTPGRDRGTDLIRWYWASGCVPWW
jgi:hypothetical protein